MTETKLKQSIKAGIQEHYESFELSGEQFAQLEQMQEALGADSLSPQRKLQAIKEQLTSRSSGSTPSEKILSIQESLNPEHMPSISTSFQYQPVVAQRKKKRRILPLLLAIGLFALGAAGLAWWFQAPNSSKTKLSPSLLGSVTGFHTRFLKPKVAANSVQALRSHLRSLNFNAIHSTHLPASQWKLVGGSKTSYSQQSAVVLHYQHRRTHKRYTLHQMAPWSQMTQRQTPWIGKHGKHSLKVWQERGLLLILVGP